ncbi:MAG TPA: hypothetical protein VIO15_05985, partial [Bacteroidales bacterium]
DVANKILGIDIYNYSFNMNISPFGPKYLESIKRKLSQKSHSGIFIVTVDCWSISCMGENPNDTTKFKENNSFIGQIKIVDQKPNLHYLLKYMFGNYYRIIFKSSDAVLHENGWFEVSINTDSVSVNRRTKSTLQEYKNFLSNYKYSQARFDYLVKTIEFLNKFGSVYLVRLPVSKGLMDIEHQCMPNFDYKIKQIADKTCGYLDLTPKNEMFSYTDGVHLDKRSGKTVTEEIAKWIKNEKK